MGKYFHFSIFPVLEVVEMIGFVTPRDEVASKDGYDQIKHIGMNGSGRHTDLKSDMSLRDHLRLRLNGFVDISSMMKDYRIKEFNKYEEPVASLYGFISCWGYKCGISTKAMEILLKSSHEMSVFIISLIDDILEWADHQYLEFRKKDPMRWESAYQWAFAFSLHVGRVILAKDVYDKMIQHCKIHHLLPVSFNYCVFSCSARCCTIHNGCD